MTDASVPRDGRDEQTLRRVVRAAAYVPFSSHIPGFDVLEVACPKEHADGVARILEALAAELRAGEPETNQVVYARYLDSSKWRAKRDVALARAAYRCQVCNGSDGLNVHHRTYERVGNEEPSDLTVLCRTCHAKFHDRIAS